jgi:phage N-6-adenine-methyltransferase
VSIRDCWSTPRPLATRLVDLFDVQIDLCADETNAVVPDFLSAEDNALIVPWASLFESYTGVGWCNPPYSDITPWVKKARYERTRGFTTVMLVPDTTSSPWFRLAVRSAGLFFFDGRIQFDPPPGIKKSSNDRGSVLFVFSPDIEPATVLGALNPRTGDVVW